MNVRGRVALVTGASSGIGHATALEFGRRGATVVAVARRRERLEDLVAALGTDSPDASFFDGDLADRDFSQGLVRRTLARHGRIDILVNNAAMPKHKSVFRLDPGEVETVMRVNFLAAAWTTLAALPPMLAQGEGVIVNVSSFAARVTPPRESVYAASKAALESFTEGLWSDLDGSGVHAGLVVPGAIDTEIWEKLDSPAAFRGRRHPIMPVVEAILEVVERRRFEIQVPRAAPSLWAARWLRAVFPGLLRRAMARFDPVAENDREEARRRASDPDA